MNIWKFTWKNIWHKKVLTWLSIMAVALASAFIVFIMLIQDGIREGATNGYGPYELIIGASGSESQLMINTFYHVGAPTGNIPFETLIDLEEMDLAEKVFPMTRGDSYKGFPLIGVPTGYLSTRYSEAILAGDLYRKEGQVVIGTNVSKTASLNIGDTFQANHGIAEDVHDELVYEVVGVLPKLGRPDDKGIFTTLNYAWIAHHDAPENTLQVDTPTSEIINQGDLTAIVVKPKGIMELQQIANYFNEIEGVQAVYSGKAISELLSIMDTGSALISVLSIVCMIIAVISIILALTAVAAERRKDIGLLRLLGKSKKFIINSILIEGIWMTCFGCMIGIVIGHLTSYLLSGTIFTYAGITIYPWNLQIQELYMILIALIIGILAALIPAFRSYKVNPLVLFHS